MTRLFLDEPIQPSAIVQLTGQQAHYVCTVLRCRPDDVIIVTDSTGSAFSARISALTRKQTTLVIIDPIAHDSESPVDIILLQGILKGDKMDLIIQKATELGVTEIVPIITERSQIRETKKLQRWLKIAAEASRQCGRNRIPLIHEPNLFEAAIAAQGARKGIIFWETEGESFSAAIDRLTGEQTIVLCIGPEGGFSEKEIRAAGDRDFSVVSLGRRILRTETAAVIAIGLTQFLLGDLSGRE